VAQKRLETSYFNDIKNFPLLSKREEWKLIRQAQDKVPGALNKLVKANLRFVIHVAYKYTNRGLDISDLINEGNRGLIKAVTEFKLNRNKKKRVKFLSYAVWWIRSSIQNAIFNQTQTIRLPVHQLALLREFKKALKITGNFSDTIALKKFKGQEFSIVNALEKLATVSFETPTGVATGDGGEKKIIQDILGNDPNQDKDIDRKELLELLDAALQNISQREELVLRMHYGISYDRSYSLAEIGAMLGVSRERVRNLRNRALRHLFHNESLRNYMGENDY
jgi:RNA polymerase primary sigma factor